MDMLTTRVTSDGQAKDFHYVVGHWDRYGDWYTAVVSGPIYPTYRAAQEAADNMARAVAAAHALKLKRQRIKEAFGELRSKGGAA